MEEVSVCEILGVPVCVTNMEQIKRILKENIEELRGKYICVSNVHTTITAYEDPEYMKVQREAALVLPDGKPLSMVSRKRGFAKAEQVAGPDLMGEMFADAEKDAQYAENCGLKADKQRKPLKHFFYGGSQETIEKLQKALQEKYPHLQVEGYLSPPFRPLTQEEDAQAVRRINESGADILWVGLGAPKQENWMHAHEGKIHAVMLGVGAGFDFHAGTVKRAPKWMQSMCLEWLYRLTQDPKRLFKRYFTTNFKFIRLIHKENRKRKKERLSC